jgi:hypothetical protein
VPRRADLGRAAPWVLSGTALALLALAVVIHLMTRDHLDATTTDTALFVVVCATNASAPLIGGLLARRLPWNPFGWLLLAIGLGLGLFAVLPTLRQADVLHYWVGGLLEFVVFLTLVPLVGQMLLLFPDGRLPGTRWRWLPRAFALLALMLLVLAPLSRWEHDPLAANPWALPATPDNPATSTPWAVRGSAGERLTTLYEAGVLLLMLLAIAAVGSIFLRFRRASPVQRQQLKWFLFAGALLVATVLPDVIDLRTGESAWLSLGAAAFGLLPIGVGIAVLRYRLYEIDRIVSRTVSYGLLSAALIGLYLLVVALLRPLLEPLTGSSTLAVASSTLAVAAVFNPARHRLQAAVDRRFDRARYDAARAVDAFAARLRNQVNLDEVTAGLRDTVVATVAPTRVAVWLRVPTRTEASEP